MKPIICKCGHNLRDDLEHSFRWKEGMYSGNWIKCFNCSEFNTMKILSDKEKRHFDFMVDLQKAGEKYTESCNKEDYIVGRLIKMGYKK